MIRDLEGEKLNAEGGIRRLKIKAWGWIYGNSQYKDLYPCIDINNTRKHLPSRQNDSVLASQVLTLCVYKWSGLGRSKSYTWVQEHRLFYTKTYLATTTVKYLIFKYSSSKMALPFAETYQEIW